MKVIAESPPHISIAPARLENNSMQQRVFDLDWKQLLYLNYYRVSLGGVFAALSLLARLPAPLGEYNPSLFSTTSLGYTLIAVCCLFTIKWRRPGFHAQVYLQVMADIVAITMLTHASGGVHSGLGMLLVISIAGGSLIMAGRTSRLFAAIATLAVLAEQLYSWLEGAAITTSYTHAGLLGASFFATAILAHVLARRLRESQALAERRGVDLANMAQLTEYVIQRMQTGILVVDNMNSIRLINASAVRLLQITFKAEGKPIKQICADLEHQLREWWNNSIYEPQSFRPAEASAEILPKFARLGVDQSAGTLIFLEDMAAVTQQAQQLKLASLGRLTASIAHEVRNPLGAISHASQLLAESMHLDAGDRRLAEIIQEHSKRVNAIIENIMQLSRRQRACPEELLLKPWLNQFIDEFTSSEGLIPGQIRVEISPSDTRVQVDPGQLHQILWNLCHNGIKHGASGGRNQVTLRVGIVADTNNPYLDVIDNGPGINPKLQQQIFEPFFTTATDGTGMGLYIARELCASNQARIDYLQNPAGGGRFRITFADPRRRQVA
jgi:two-component system sensor histidine kinase PilS (NtrC family)